MSEMKCNIALMQHGLLRIALALGVEVRANAKYEGLKKNSQGRWTALFTARGSKAELAPLDFDAIFDGTGTRSAVGGTVLPKCEKPLFHHIVQKSSVGKKVAVTLNWKRFPGDTDKKWAFGETEFTAVGHKMMHDLGRFKSKGLNPKVKLDDLVYFQSTLSNYVVMAANADELQEKFHIFKDPSSHDMNVLLANDNVIRENLEKLVKQVSEDWQIPHDPEVGMMERGINQMSLFEFMNLYYSGDEQTKEVRMIHPLPGKTDSSECEATQPMGADAQYVVAIGDSLWAPFWPDGTGMSRGILSVLHASFTLNNIWNNAKTPDDRKRFIEMGDRWARIGTSAQGSDCKSGKCEANRYEEYVTKGYASQDTSSMPLYFSDWM